MAHMYWSPDFFDEMKTLDALILTTHIVHPEQEANYQMRNFAAKKQAPRARLDFQESNDLNKKDSRLIAASVDCSVYTSLMIVVR